MRTIQIKIREEMEEREKIHTLAKDDKLNWNNSMKLYHEIVEKNKKIEFLKKLSSALKRQEYLERKKHEILNKK